MILLEKLNDILDKLNKSEKEQTYLELALYNKNKKVFKENKIENEKIYLEDQANFFNQNVRKVQDKVMVNLKLYEVTINRLVYIYDILFEELIMYKQNILNNQKILVGNIIFYAQKYELAVDEKEKEVYYSEIQDQINKIDEFEKLIDVCDEKILWLLEDLRESIDNIFINNNTQIAVSEKIISRVIKGFKNIFVGKKKYKSFNDSYIIYINKLSNKVIEKEEELAKISVAFKKKIKNSKKKILA